MTKEKKQEEPAFTFKLRECDFVVEAARRNGDESAAINELLVIDPRHGLVWQIASKEIEEGMVTVTVSNVISHMETDELNRMVDEKYQAYCQSRGL